MGRSSGAGCAHTASLSPVPSIVLPSTCGSAATSAPPPPAPAGLLNGASPLLSLLALGHGLCQETSSLWRVSPTCCAIAPCLHTLLGQNDFLIPYSCGSGLLPAAGICPYSPALRQSKLLTDRQLLALGFCLMFGQHLLRAMLSAVWAVALALELTGPGTADTEQPLQSATRTMDVRK